MERVKVFTKEKCYEGLLLESYDPEIVLLKLKNGYNIGIEKKSIIRIEKLGKISREEKKHEKEKSAKEKENLPKIAIIATGGTIASRVDYTTGGVLAVEKPQDLLENFPELEQIARFEVYVPFSMDSSQMSSKEWKKLARLSAKLLNKKDIKGIVILHGTDTLHYTASALSFMLHNINKPVVLTYSQRSIDRGSSDAHLNFKCACLAALSDIAEVMVVGHEDTSDLSCVAFRGTKVRKMHSSKRAAFQSINEEPLARIFSDRIEILNHRHKKRDEKAKVKALPFFEEKVALIKFFPGASKEIFDYFVKNKYKGIVIEAFGMGQISEKWIKSIKKAIASGIVVCIASQTIHGRVNPYVYAPARKLKKAGALFLQDMLSETAFVKLGWLLAQYDEKKVKQLMLENFAHELNERLTG
ncbi:MAG: Glu-tRNA(Gln) amidotransferase subunit GatD [Candidatus Pacearchaeota archaeon]